MNKKSKPGRFIYLTNYELASVVLKILAVAAGMAVFQLVSLTVVMVNDANTYLRFEELLETAGFKSSFIVAGALALGIIGLSFYKNWIGSKSIYALLGLPSGRELVYFSKLTAAVLAALVLMTIQFANIFVSYGYYLAMLPEVPKVRNGLLLSFMRWDFLGIFFPAGFGGFLLTAALVLAMPAAVLFIVAAERSKRYKMALLVTALSVVAVILPLPSGGWVNWILVLALTSVFSIRLIKEGGIA